MPWLTRDEEVLASVEVRRRPGGPLDAVVVLRRPTLVHAVGSGRVDVAWCTRAEDGAAGLRPDGEPVVVRRTTTLSAIRPVMPGLWMPIVILAGAGSFERWRLRAGDRLVITGG